MDPICGTLNFAAGLPLFAVNVALEVDGVTAAAAVVDPVAGDVFWTDGDSAWQRIDGVDRVLCADIVVAPRVGESREQLSGCGRHPGAVG